MSHILLVDDDPEIRVLLDQYLSQNAFTVTAFSDAETLLSSDLDGDCLILDISLPGMDGLAACRAVRERAEIPIIMLTAASDDVDRILGLELGADDYMGKPFNPRELLARIRALLRRSVAHEFKDTQALVLNKGARAIEFQGASVELTGAEFVACQVLVDAHPEVVNRNTLSQALHGRNAQPFDRTVDTAVSRLRSKLSKLNAEGCIRSVRGKGYVWINPS